MHCPKCDNDDSKVLESRELNESNAIRRRRECLGCKHRFTTYERLEMPYVAVKKRDGSEQTFDRGKIIAGISRAVEKRPITMLQVESLVSDIERAIYEAGETEVSSIQIGKMVMERLLELDDVAYVRFASVYRSFADVESFEKELAKLKKRATNVE